jgi:hypothetical protein
MATVKWSALTSRGNQLTTELNSLANGAFSALSAAHDNSSNLDRWGWIELSLNTLNPTTGACVSVYLVPSIDGGTDYDTGPSSTNPASHLLVATLSVATGSATKKLVSQAPFPLPPGHFKFCLRNQTGVAFNAASNVLAFWTSNEAVA